eukprot:TRINITY_DN47226_c0_g1_i1.p1 TRINITY_DN47226_c0_g1~~TRINITY_DN47226_c0_g1_i1.p1  ORF type:complete len:488 (-),score=133.05 TRINITY_DN47226_c0_g1_i1:193-1656(-)
MAENATPDAGLDFVRAVARDIKVLQENYKQLNEQVTELLTTVSSDRRIREGSVNGLHERISRESAVQTQMRAALEKRADEFEAKAKQWITNLGKETSNAHDHLRRLDEALLEHARQQTESQVRIADLDAQGARKADMEALATQVASLSGDVERDRAETAASIASSVSRAAHEAKLLLERMDTLSHQVSADKKAMTLDLNNLNGKVESLNQFASTRAKLSDLQGVDLRLTEAERALHRAQEDIGTKAPTSVVHSLSDRVTVLGMDAHANAARAEAGDEKLSSELGKVSQSLAKTIRQNEIDRGLWSSSLVALERRLAESALATSVDAIAIRMTTAEEIIQPMQRTVAGKAGANEVANVVARINALEDGFSNKADVSVTARLELAMADTTTKTEALQLQANDLNGRLSRLAGAKQQSDAQLSTLETRANELEATLSKKPNAGDVHTKDSMDELLRDYYRKEETDAQLARVWWRVGDIGKPSRVVTPVRH